MTVPSILQEISALRLPFPAELAVGFLDGQVVDAGNMEKARLAAAMLQVGPARFTHRRHVETVARPDELDFIVG